MSKKCQYALKAVFELAWRNNDGPVKTHDIAEAQQISPRFTEIILNELKHGGFVESKRGNEGGYMLAQDAKNVTVRDVIECIEGPISVVPDVAKEGEGVAFWVKEIWQQINNAICEVCENKTFADLVELERAKRDKYALNYSI
ncbi:MAG: RrF2 family transcriptional regulator [Planctomycetota bacterium]